VPNSIHPPPGCHFHIRCPIAQPMCKEQAPKLEESPPGHHVACHFRGKAQATA
jgi:oligopeptide/dipeptide ABC transporter ATP-binding protein